MRGLRCVTLHGTLGGGPRAMARVKRYLGALFQSRQADDPARTPLPPGQRVKELPRCENARGARTA